jgi:hypothetical protein
MKNDSMKNFYTGQDHVATHTSVSHKNGILQGNFSRSALLAAKKAQRRACLGNVSTVTIPGSF